MAVHNNKKHKYKQEEKEREAVEGKESSKKGKSIKNAPYFPGVVRTKAFQAFP